MADGVGKGAWDCQENKLIPPEKEATVFEEIATMDYPYEGIPTVPPRKDMDHFAFFCSGKRYLVVGQPSESVAELKQRAFAGGLCSACNPETEVHKWEDIVFIYAGQVMDDARVPSDYHVPPGCKCCIAISQVKIDRGKPDPESAYWN